MSFRDKQIYNQMTILQYYMYVFIVVEMKYNLFTN